MFKFFTFVLSLTFILLASNSLAIIFPEAVIVSADKFSDTSIFLEVKFSLTFILFACISCESVETSFSVNLSIRDFILASPVFVSNSFIFLLTETTLTRVYIKIPNIANANMIKIIFI